MQEQPDRIPFAESNRWIKLWDIAKGVGEIALDFLTKQVVHEPQPFESDHYHAEQTSE